MAETSSTAPPPGRIRVLVVDDSEICRYSIVSILQADGDIEVIGEGEDGFSALGLVESLAPDLVTMDVQMPGKSGLEAVEQIMACAPVPILVVTAEALGDHQQVAFTAIQNGALDIVSKPSITDVEAGAALRVLVRTLSQIPVFRQVEQRSLTAMPPVGPAIDVIGIASGKGGVASVIGLLARLPEDLAVPVVLFEPMPADQVPAYARHLARICKLPIRIGQAPDEDFRPGEILLITSSRATWIGGSGLRLDTGEPSAFQFFYSLAHTHGARSAGIVLRGDVIDGETGLIALRDAGGKVFAEVSPISPPSNRTQDSLLGADSRKSLAEIALGVIVLAQ